MFLWKVNQQDYRDLDNNAKDLVQPICILYSIFYILYSIFCILYSMGLYFCYSIGHKGLLLLWSSSDPVKCRSIVCPTYNACDGAVKHASDIST